MCKKRDEIILQKRFKCKMYSQLEKYTTGGENVLSGSQIFNLYSINIANFGIPRLLFMHNTFERIINCNYKKELTVK